MAAPQRLVSCFYELLDWLPFSSVRKKSGHCKCMSFMLFYPYSHSLRELLTHLYVSAMQASSTLQSLMLGKISLFTVVIFMFPFMYIWKPFPIPSYIMPHPWRERLIDECYLYATPRAIIFIHWYACGMPPSHVLFMFLLPTIIMIDMPLHPWSTCVCMLCSVVLAFLLSCVLFLVPPTTMWFDDLAPGRVIQRFSYLNYTVVF